MSGLGFSIPINNVTRSIDDFVETGSVRYGWLGVSIRSITADIAEDLALPHRRGALVHHVFLDSPAEKGGLRPGDFITEINGTRVENSDAPRSRSGGTSRRQGTPTLSSSVTDREERLSVRIAERESEREIANLNMRLWPGFSVFPLSPEIRDEMENCIDSRRIGRQYCGEPDFPQRQAACASVTW